ncbi:TetR/AcrR family transcriptional regulator [Paeniglutamicibacter gangotriensis]|uniref:TetR family transcriptional regulator n=2 Tax=Paeniglutamicibacter gangotriensis TaxID=254787 RepID=M7NPE3_9MICC|nr:TetR/AcrR family transcriptional regulator [Paeniglutamicibacter gangotriensis]EMR00389.1 TetR family transcriptional regulator [Paeniglutamicibacter gangotriensis Lz1y]KAA0973220.1 TetR/AcrR family transcriptional regulator [Paeniglutamicibacter gangotriensis]
MNIEKVQQAAVLLFARQGFAATGIRELGAGAGINSATIYHYAGSKEELLVQVMRGCLDEMIASGSAALRISAEPTLQLAALVSSHVGFTATNPLTARVAEYEMRALSPENQPAMQKLRDDYESLFAQIVERGIRVGEFTTDDATMARLALMEMGTGVAHWYRPDGRLGLTEVQHNFVAMACKILSADQSMLEGIEFIRPPVRLSSEPPDMPAAVAH